LVKSTIPSNPKPEPHKRQSIIRRLIPAVPTSPAIRILILGTFLLLVACESQPSPTPMPTTAAPEATSTPTTTPVPPTATVTPQPTSSLGVEPSALNGVTVSFWHPLSGEIGRVIQQSIQEFNESNAYGITIESAYQGTINSLNELIAGTEPGGELPSLTIGSNYQILSWNRNGKRVVGLNAYVNDPEWGLSPDEQADFYPIFLEQDVSGQNRIGFPAARSAQLIFYNTSWARELGFTSPPGTTEEFKEQACQAAHANLANDLPSDDGSGGWLINATPSAVLSWLYAFGSQVLQPDGNGYHFNTPQAENTFSYLKELFDQGCAFEMLESPAMVEFANRKALFITGALSDLTLQSMEFEFAGNDDHWTVLGFPTPQGEPVIDVYGPSYTMFAGSPQENLATWLVIKWLTSAEQQAKFVAASGTFPTRSSSMDLLADYASQNPQWASAQELIAYAQPEPGLQSWNEVRWVLGDVGTQTFRYYFTPDRIPSTLELMDETAAELHERTR
jgi:multiple sugar transport system substrate-binding protein